MWPDAVTSSPQGSAYAALALHEATRARGVKGAVVPERALRGLLDYLERQLHSTKTRPAEGAGGRFALGAAAAHALASHGRDVQAAAMRLFALRQGRSLAARAQLLMALGRSRRTTAVHHAVEVLTRELVGALKVTPRQAWIVEPHAGGDGTPWHSDVGTTALVLLALLDGPAPHPICSRLLRWLVEGCGGSDSWHAPQAAFAFLALSEIARRAEASTIDFSAGVWLGEKRLNASPLGEGSPRVHTVRMEMARLAEHARHATPALSIGMRGRGTLYYVARLHYSRRGPPKTATHNGFGVDRLIEVLDGGGDVLAKPRPPRVGDHVLVTLRVRSQRQRRFVLVEDPLPAGLAPVATTLGTSASSFGATGERADSSPFDHRAMRTDRVVFIRESMKPGTLVLRYLARVVTSGTFLAPPPRAEEMYDPEVLGHGAAGIVTYSDARMRP